LTLPHGRDGLSMRRMAVFCTVSRPSICRQVHREFMRNALPNLTTIVPTTACCQRNYAETYSRSIRTRPAGEPRPREAQVAQGRLPVHPASGHASPTALAARGTVAGAGQAAQAGLE
jgi:hypothetical protein